VTIQGSAEPMIADNTIGGSLVWQSSSTEVYGFGNTVKGNIVVQNSSGGLFEFNTASGTCTIQNSVLPLSNNSGANPCVVQ
jgi:glutamate synthase domain-containing protein 3